MTRAEAVEACLQAIDKFAKDTLITIRSNYEVKDTGKKVLVFQNMSNEKDADKLGKVGISCEYSTIEFLTPQEDLSNLNTESKYA